MREIPPCLDPRSGDAYYRSPMFIKAHHRQYAAVCLFDFAIVAGLSVSPFYMFHYLDGGAKMSGVVTGIQWAIYALACLASAPLVTRAKNGLWWAYIGAIGFALLFPLAIVVRNAYFFGALTSVALAFTGLFWPAMQSWIGAEPDPALRMRRMSHYNVAWTIGLTTAPAIAGPLYNADYRIPFVLTGLMALASFALVLTLPHEKAHFSAPPEQPEPGHEIQARRSVAHLYTAWVSIFCACALITAVGAIYPKRMEELVAAGTLTGVQPAAQLFGLDGSTPALAVMAFSWLAFALNASRAGMSVVMGFSHIWQHRFWLIAGLQALGGLAMWELGRTRYFPLMAVCCVAMGAISGFCFFASQTYSVAEAGHKHRRLTIHEFMVGAGCFVGAVAYGLLAERFTTPWPFVASPLLVAAALLIETALLPLGERHAARTPEP